MDGDRLIMLAIARMESPAAIPCEISSRSENDKAREERFLSGGLIPPVRARRGKIEEEFLSKSRPIELIDSSTHRVASGPIFVIAVPLNNRYDVFVSYTHFL